MQFLHERDEGQLVARDAADFFGKAEVHEAQLAECHGRLEADMVVYFVGLLDRFGGEVLFGVFLRACEEEFLVRCEIKIHAGPSCIM